jgi:hypothetical protein
MIPAEKPVPNDPLQKLEMATVNETGPAAAAGEEDNVK